MQVPLGHHGMKRNERPLSIMTRSKLFFVPWAPDNITFKNKTGRGIHLDLLKIIKVPNNKKDLGSYNRFCKFRKCFKI